MSHVTDRELQGLQRELEAITRYPKSVCFDMALDNFPEFTYSMAAKMLVDQKDSTYRSVGLWASSRCVQSDYQPTSFDGRALTELEFHVESLRWNRDYYLPYYSLGTLLPSGEFIQLADGRSLCDRELLVESNRCNPTFTFVFCNLAMDLSDTETITLCNGITYTKRSLYLHGLTFGDDDDFFNNLGTCLSRMETVTLHDGRTFSKEQLYIEAIAQNTNCRNAYHNLGILIRGNTVKLKDGRTLSKRACFEEALRCDPSYSSALEQLEMLLPPTEPWSRRKHAIIFQKATKTNQLFATLFLGLQRLEEAGVLALAHHAMLEDMLECWTWADR